MLIGNNRNRFPVLQQMRGMGFTSNDNTDSGGWNGDPDTFQAFADQANHTFSIEYGGDGGGDPWKNIHIPAQNTAGDAFASILNTLDARRLAGTVTRGDVTSAAAAIERVYTTFKNYTDGLAAQHPHDANRYNAGARDIVNLGKQIISDMIARFAYLGGITPPAGSGNSGVVGTVSDFISQNSNALILAAVVLFLPRLFSAKAKS